MVRWRAREHIDVQLIVQRGGDFADYDFRSRANSHHISCDARTRGKEKLSQSSCNNSRAGLHIAVRKIFTTSHSAFICCKILRLAYSLIQDREKLTAFICAQTQKSSKIKNRACIFPFKINAVIVIFYDSKLIFRLLKFSKTFQN